MSHQHRPSTTSLPRDPREESDTRVRKYAVMMLIRVVCFILMVFVQPYGWYTFVFGAGAAVLPYLAVVIANVGAQDPSDKAETPERQLSAPVRDSTTDAPQSPPAPTVITLSETPAQTNPSEQPTAPGSRRPQERGAFRRADGTWESPDVGT